MATTAPAATEKRAATNLKQQYLDTAHREHATTMRVLRAYPTNKLDLRPHAVCKTARDLAWMFVMEQGLAEKALTTGFDWSKPPSGPPPAPESFDAILGALEEGHKRVVNIVNRMDEDQFFETVKFFTGPKTIGDVPKIQMLWMALHDQIHHRGQFSVYLRMADGKVPSIYGPSHDEPWL